MDKSNVKTPTRRDNKNKSTSEPRASTTNANLPAMNPILSARLRDIDPEQWLNIPLPIVKAIQVVKAEVMNLQQETFQ